MTKIAFIRCATPPECTQTVNCDSLVECINQGANVVVIGDRLTEDEVGVLGTMSEDSLNSLYAVFSLEKSTLGKEVLELLGSNFVGYTSGIEIEAAMELGKLIHKKEIECFVRFDNGDELNFAYVSGFPT